MRIYGYILGLFLGWAVVCSGATNFFNLNQIVDGAVIDTNATLEITYVVTMANPSNVISGTFSNSVPDFGLWGLDDEANLSPIPFVIVTNAGLWIVGASGEMQGKNTTQFDKLWELDVNDDLTPKD